MAYDDDDEPGTLILQTPEKAPLPGAFRPAIASQPQAAQPAPQPQPRAPRKHNWAEGETGEEHTVDIGSMRNVPVLPFARADKTKPAPIAAPAPPARLAPTQGEQAPVAKQPEHTIGQRMVADYGQSTTQTSTTTSTAAPSSAVTGANAWAPSTASASAEPARLDGGAGSKAPVETAQAQANEPASTAPSPQKVDPAEEKEFLALATAPWLLPD